MRNYALALGGVGVTAAFNADVPRARHGPEPAAFGLHDAYSADRLKVNEGR